MTADDPAAATRDDTAIAELFEAHGDFVWRALMRLGIPEAAAEDALQDVFVVAHSKLERLDRRNCARPWLFAIARRVASEHRRASTRASRREAQAPPPTAEPADPEAAAARSEAAEHAAAFLASLDESRRVVFYLSEIEGLSGPEIAAALGEKLNTVYTRLRAARKRFQEYFDGER